MRSAWRWGAVLVGAIAASGCDLVFVLESPHATPDGHASDGNGVDASSICPGQDDRIDLNSNGTPDCLENLILNGQFGSDVSHWTAYTNVTASWSSMDARGSVLSGSMLVGNGVQLLTANAGGVTSDCFRVDPANSAVHLYLHYLIASGQPGGDAAVQIMSNMSNYTDGACSIGIGTTSGNVTCATKDAWAVCSQLYTVTGTSSMKIGLLVLKGATTSTVSARFDNVLVVPGP